MMPIGFHLFKVDATTNNHIYIYKYIIHNVGFYGSLLVSTGWAIGFWSANMEFNPMSWGRWLVGLEEGFLGLQGSFAGFFHKQVKSHKTCLILSGRLIVVRTTLHLLLRMKLYSRSLNSSIFSITSVDIVLHGVYIYIYTYKLLVNFLLFPISHIR